MSKYSLETEDFVFDGLIVGKYPIVTKTVTIGASQTLVRGSVLGKITGGNYILSLSAAIDGSETPNCICSESVTTGVGETATAVVYLSGEFSKSALTLGTAHTLASVEEGLREKGIFLKDTVS